MRSTRKPPRLRRTFPEPDPSSLATIRERNQRAFEAEPRLAELERRLLDLGGHAAFLFLREPHLEEILLRGRWMSAARALSRPGTPSNCHGNTARLYVLSEGRVRIATGYALSDDGLWCQHSWGITVDGHLIETTVRRRRYYGYVLDDGDESVRFFAANTPLSEFTPEGVETILQFICSRMSPEMRAMIEAVGRAA